MPALLISAVVTGAVILAARYGKIGKEWQAALLILAGLFAAWHVIPALAVRDNPPLACQVAGGSWSIWSGWHCG